MFKKQVDKKVSAPEPKPEPVVAEEMPAPLDAEELVEGVEDEQVSEEADTEEPTLDGVLTNHEQRIQQIEAALFRIKGSI